jgi:hypothetical protein
VQTAHDGAEIASAAIAHPPLMALICSTRLENLSMP